MNFKTQNAKNLISKDAQTSKNAANAIIQSCDVESFQTLCDNSDNIFDFIKEKIVNNLAASVTKQDLDKTFEFAKIYDCALGEFIVKSWLKYADEDLTDNIIELLENGCDAQKIYALKYFQKINDPAALDLIRECAKNHKQEISAQAAKTLGAFKDEFFVEEMLQKLQNSDDDFKIYSAAKFLINYGSKDYFSLLVDTMQKSAFGANIACDILYEYDLCDINPAEILKIYDEIISAYPEDISLDTIYDFNILSFIDTFMPNSQNSYTHRILADLKTVLTLANSDKIYTYDLDKNCLNEIKSACEKLKSFSPCVDIIKNELHSDEKRVLRALSCILETNLAKDCSNEIIALANNTQNSAILCQCAKTTKSAGFIDKLDKQKLLQNINDANAKALFESYFS